MRCELVEQRIDLVGTLQISSNINYRMHCKDTEAVQKMVTVLYDGDSQ
jgi:hypothetical protein